jgi:hypothetical protein
LPPERKVDIKVDILLKITFDSITYQTALGTAGEPSQKMRENNGVYILFKN